MLKKFILVLSIMLLGSFAFAQDMDWAALTSKAVQKGETSESHGSVFKTVKDIEFPKAEYFSVVGGNGEDGAVDPLHLEFASERWIKNEDGNWDIDQWLFAMTLEGQPYIALHNHLIQTESGTILFYDVVPTNDEEETTKLTELYELWENKL